MLRLYEMSKAPDSANLWDWVFSPCNFFQLRADDRGAISAGAAKTTGASTPLHYVTFGPSRSAIAR